MSLRDLKPVLFLASQTALYRSKPTRDLARMFLPPLALGQYVLVSDDDAPVAYVSWATLTDEAAEGFKTRSRPLQATDWNAGTNLWFIDLIAPTGIPRGLLGHMRTLFPHHKQANWTRSFGTGSVKRIGEINHGVHEAPSGAAGV